MANFNFNSTSGIYSVTATLTKQVNTIDIPTKEKYTKGDFKLSLISQTASATYNTAGADVTINTTDGSNAGVNISGVVGTKTTTEPSSGYYISVNAFGSGSSKITRAGWISTGNLAAATSTAQTKYFSIAAAQVSNAAAGSSTINSATFTYDISTTRFNLTGVKALSGTATLTVTSAGYLPKANVYGALSGTATLSTTVARVGLGATLSNGGAVTPTLTKTTDGNALSGSITTSKPGSGYYVAVKSNASTKTLIAAPKVTSDGYGTTSYYGATTATSTVGANASSVHYVPITTGSVSVTATGAGTVSSLTYTYDATATNFKVAGSVAISGSTTAIVSEGYVKGHVSGAVSGTINVNTTVAKVGVKSTLGGATTGRKPTISRTNTSASGATNIGSAAATTTAPTSGYFVSVQSATNVAAITATASVNSAGYGTTSYYTPTHAGTTVGANASDVTYIPITSGSVTISNVTVNKNPGISVCATNGYITSTYSGSGTISPSVTPGWVASVSGASITTGGTATLQMTTKGATTYNISTSNQFINSGTFLTGTATFRAVTTSNIDAGNIKHGVVVKVGDAGDAGRIKNVTGTFTSASTVSTGQTAAAAGQILNGYSAWVNGAEVKGNIAAKSANDVNVQTATAYVASGYYATTASKAIKTGSASTPATTIAQAPTITMATATGVITAKYSKSQSITPTVSAGWVTSGTAGTVSTTGNNTLTLAQPIISVSGKTVTINPGWVGSTTAYNVSTTSMTYGVSSVSSNNAISRGIASWGTGWITSGSITAAKFSNVATNGATASYVDISDTLEAPILTSNDYLYIDAGYTDKLKISLAKLVPNSATITGSTACNQILNGYAAYNNEGILLAGSIPSYDSSNLAATGATVYVKPGYYGATAAKAISNGAYSANIGLTDITVTPSVSINNSSTYGFTTTTPSGTNGTNYLTIDPGANTPTYSATATAKIDTAGYLSTGSKFKSASKTITVAAGTNYYVPVIVPTISGGDLSGSTTSSITTNMSTSTSAVYYIDASASGTATRALVKYSNPAGVATTHVNTTSINATYKSVSSTATRVFVPTAVLASEGSVTTAPKVTTSHQTNMVTASNGTYYYKVTNATTNGTVQTKYSVTGAGYTPTKSATNGGTVTVTPTKSDDVQIYIPTSSYTIGSISGGGVSCSAKTLTSCTATTTDSLNSGVAIKFTASRAAASVATTATAGYMPASNKTASLAVGSADSSTYYLQGVTLTPPSANQTRSFDITVPNGNTSDYITFRFTVDSAGNVTVAGP